MYSPQILLTLTFLVLALLALLFWPERGIYPRWRRNRRLTARVLMEDALKHIFTCEMDDRMPSLQSIAGALTVSQNEAADIVARLEKRDLIRTEQAVLTLTSVGREYALRVVRAHRLWERYLAEKTGFAEIEWHRMAERHEHRLSEADADKLSAILGNPSHDPHGDPIPTASGELAGATGLPLSRVSESSTVRVVHIEDEPAVIYSQLVAEGLHTGMVLRVIEHTADRIRFWAEGNEHVLAPLLAGNITVEPIRRDAHVPQAGLPLNQLEPGQKGRVVQITPGIRGAERRRLMDLGILPGTEIKAELKSPSGDPTAYLVRGALIALRADQAQHIKIMQEGTSA